ncbi:MAG: hypothetical protein ACYDCP_03715, partial [Thermoplasmataceae archaeon]
MNLKKLKVNGLTIAILLSVILTGFAVIPATAYAQSPTAVVDQYGWAGYNGNNSVYMSDSTSLRGNAYELPYETSHTLQGPNSILGTGKNGVALGVDSPICTTSSRQVAYEKYSRKDGALHVYITSYTAGGTNQTRLDDTNNGEFNIYGTSMSDLSMKMSGIPKTNLYLLNPGVSGAVNLTFPAKPTSSSHLSIINQSLSLALGLVPYIGPFVDVPLLASQFASFGVSPSIIYSGSGINASVTENLTANPNTETYYKEVKGTGQNEGYNTYYGQNVFASEILSEISINTSNFNLRGNLNISASNELGVYLDNGGWDSMGGGARTNINISFVPANTLSGSVTNYGKPLPDQQIIISQTYNGTTTDFYEHTNSSGDYRFFVEPGSSYLNLNMDYPGTVTFHESGLSSGTTWSVTLNGVTDSTTSGTISFSEPFGTYSYSIESISGYSISPQSGSIELNDFSYSKDITFTSVGPVTFHESGLPSGTSWEAYVGSYSGSGTGTSLTVTAPTGTYSYSIPNVDVKMSNGDTDVYSANPSGG